MGVYNPNSITAKRLATARAIGGVNFDGTAAITLPGVNAAGTQNTSGNAATATALSTVNGSAPSYACRAWVNFDGTTASIRGASNVSSITDNGVGNFTINFTTAMPNSTYCAVCSTNANGNTCTAAPDFATFTGSGFSMKTIYSNATLYDGTLNTAAVFA